MITLKDAIKKAKDSYKLGLISKDGYIEITDIGDDSGYYGFDAVFAPDENFRDSMLCVSKKDGEVLWLGGGYLFTHYDMTNIIKEPI